VSITATDHPNLKLYTNPQRLPVDLVLKRASARELEIHVDALLRQVATNVTGPLGRDRSQGGSPWNS
jgi:hypothetical protein